jgi:predicted RNA-binding Zn-ribbon protein involved in translation (DUF1610 family)
MEADLEYVEPEEGKQADEDEGEGYAFACTKCGHELVQPEDVYEGECPVCGGAMQRKEEPEEGKADGPYQCECLECGHKMESDEHCRDVPCPECGAEMRRADRPGAGKDDAPDEEKAGRVLAARNAQRIVAAIQKLIETLEDAGIDVPGFGDEPPDRDIEEKAKDQAGDQAGTGEGDEEPTAPPTSKGLDDLRLQVAQLDVELELLEV